MGDVNWSPRHYDIVLWGTGLTAEATGEVEYVPPVGPGQVPIVRYHLPEGVVVHSSPYPGEPVGQEGGVCFVGTAGRMAVDRTQLVSDPPDLLRPLIRPGERYLYHSDSYTGNSLDCVRTRRVPVCALAVAVHTMDCILAGGIALALQRSLRWNGLRRQFTRRHRSQSAFVLRTAAPWVL